MAGWRKQLRNAPVADPVTRAAKNLDEDVGRYTKRVRELGSKGDIMTSTFAERTQMRKSMEAFQAMTGRKSERASKRYAPKGVSK